MSQQIIEGNGEDDVKSVDATVPNISCADLSTRFELHGWQPDLTLSDDENYMDLVMLVTRNSICLQGYMGCVIVNPNRAITTATDDEVSNCKMPQAPSDNSPLSPQQQQPQQQQQQQKQRQRIYHGIIGASTNLPLFTPSDSDIHAEIGALGQCNQHGNSTKGSTAYITMPPCKRCFAALLSAGVTKIIAQQRHPDVILRTAKERGIMMVDMGIGYKAEQLVRVERLIDNGAGGDGDNANSLEERKQLIDERRKRRKEQKQAKKHAKKERRSTLQTMHEHTNSLDSNTQKDTDT